MRRRRATALLAVAALVGVAVILALRIAPTAVRHFTLPLNHQDIIRQQAADKQLDAALIAAVIYQESKFRDQTSSAGAKGLMQLMPSTARFIAHKSGGTQFQLQDLGTPQVNIAYGSWYLRYLIAHYNGNTTLGVAAYNAGMVNVDKWVKRVGGPGNFDAGRNIPFPETRHYVLSVLSHQEQYRKNYRKELGLQ
ncbi:MAG TPA: lytic transglycosylase domain-containing protein [Thermoleophilaceae bacterium]|nr:lytic transglycosylase domain-containing protein [Thermoleophilaceae bacterium]